MKQYNPKLIEPKWQKVWEKALALSQAKDFDSQREKYYVLVEFPYPSGDGLHTGHVRSYTAQDIVARRLRMMGKNVLYPMGWDAFGLPTENYAIKNKVKPQDATATNIAIFKRQMKDMGFSFDWSREINTTDPKYYKWTQWIFLQLYKKGLAYQAEIPINWCPSCRTGLANEEVVNGRHERCGTPVVKKILKQWLLKITAYADRLIKDLKTVDYLEQVTTQQINWIGKSHGVELSFKIDGSKAAIKTFTTRIDTLYGVTFIVLAPEHPLVDKLVQPDHKSRAQAYLGSVASKSELDRQQEEGEKHGVFTGTYAINPATKDKVPVWIADYVLMSYGTGAVMGVPGHDQRDYEFAKKYQLPIKTVIEPSTGQPQQNPEFRKSIVAIVEDPANGKLLSINWGHTMGGHLFVGGGLDKGEDPEKCGRREVSEETGYSDLELVGQTETIHHSYFAASKNKARQIEAVGLHFRLRSHKRTKPKLEADEAGKFKVEWLSHEEAEAKVKDELHALAFNRLIKDRVHAGEGSLVNSGKFDGLAVADAQAKMTDWAVKQGFGRRQVQYKLRDWIFSRQHYWGEPIPVIHCDKCGVVPVPEKDLPVELPEVEHYEPTETGESPLAAIIDWVQVQCPKCGGKAHRETDTMPNWAGSSWYYLRYIDPSNDKLFADPKKLKYWSPVDLYNGGMEHTTLHLLYSRFWHKFLYDEGHVPTSEPYAKRRSHGMILAPDGKKMSKSLGNVINPDDTVKEYGADTLRLHEMFMGPYAQAVAWDQQGIAGTRRFLDRVWTLVRDFLREHVRPTPNVDNETVKETRLAIAVARSVKKVSQDLEDRSFNTAVAAMMETSNELYKLKEELPFATSPQAWQQAIEDLVKLLAPFAPHITEELWQELGHKDSIHIQSWPNWDEKLLKEDMVTVVVQVNGKLRASLTLPAKASEAEMVKAAKADAKVSQFIEKDKLVKTITVPGKLVNFVVA